MSKFLSLTLLFAALLVAWPNAIHASTSPVEIQSRIEAGALLYFDENTDATTGLTLDRAKNSLARDPADRAASMAATGFGLAVEANAAARGLRDKAKVYDNTLKTLRYSRDHLTRWHGWFYHFVDWQTGERMVNTEFSTIDTALFIAGALYAGAIFPNSEVAQIAHQLYVDLDFETFLTDGGARPKKRTLSMGYSPEQGYIATQWDMYAEEMILLVLGLGHPTHPLPADVWLTFSRENRGGLMGYDQALFTHQYSQLFLDLRQFDDGFPNYFQNSRGVTLRMREAARSDSRFETLREGFWGFSAGLAPNWAYDVSNLADFNSTICIGCAVASVQFAPDEVLKDLEAWNDGAYDAHLWGRYGLIDSLDLDQNWFADRVFGITIGPAYLSFANLTPETSIWKTFMQIPEIETALKRAAP